MWCFGYFFREHEYGNCGIFSTLLWYLWKSLFSQQPRIHIQYFSL
jgi:hypothetical protein